MTARDEHTRTRAPLDLAAIERWTDRQRAVIAEYAAHPDHICRHQPRCAVVTNGARP